MNQVPPTFGYTQGTGSSSSNQFVEFFSDRDPNSNDTQFPIQKRWFNVNTNTEWILVSFSTNNAILQANWQEITTASEAVLSFTVPSGTNTVVPNASGQVQLVTNSGPTSLSIVGATNSITMNLAVTPTVGFLLPGLVFVTPNSSTGLISYTSNSINITSGSSNNVNFEVNIGSRIESSASSGSVALTDSVAANITSIVLTQGIWEVSGAILFEGVSGSANACSCSISTISATVGTSAINNFQMPGPKLATYASSSFVPSYTVTVASGTQNVYLVGLVIGITAGTISAGGRISATKVG